MENVEGKIVEKAHKHPNYLAVYIALALITALITAIELLSHNLALPKTYVHASFVVMSVTKAVLVAMFYMHLKSDSRVYTFFFGLPVLFAVFLVFILIV